MKVFGHRKHRYEHLATGAMVFVPEGDWVEVPDVLGHIIVNGHPDKLCNVSDEENPSAHVCPLSHQPEIAMAPAAAAVYEQTMVEAPPQTTVMHPRLSPQKLALKRKTLKRSLKARREDAGS